jgi:hypothetical protein
MPFIDDERAMELPQYSEFIPKLGTVDLSVPTKENRELNRRITQRDADLMRQVQADRSFPEKLAGGLQAGRLMGSALAQSVASIPTAITKGGKAAEEYIAENMYKPTQPLAYEYAGDIGDFLEKLETQYKIPPVLPEAMALQYLTGPATAQAMRTAGKGAEQAGRAIERRMEPVVRGALEQGGLPREMVMAMGANTQSNVIKPKGGNWLRGDVEKALDPLLAQGMINNRNIPYGPEFDLAIRQRIEDLKQAASQPDYKGGAGRVAEHLEREMENPRTNEVALNKWIQSNLTNYVKKEMGTPEDPVRKLAEQGISHLPRDLQNIEMTWTPEELAKTRKRFGFPEEETATNPTAKMWEQMADEMIAPSRATEFGEKARQQNPWLEKLNPYDTVYETMRGMPQALKFDHIVDVLRQDVASGRIRPEQLNKVSMEQAVRRTFEYDQELARKMNEARATSRAELPVYKDYPEGFKWVELNRPGDFAAESDAMGHSVRGYEPPKGHPDWVEGSSDSGSSSYGLGGWEAIKSGDAKVYSLVDAKGEPHVTVEVGKARPTQADIEKQPQEVQDEFTRRFDNWVYGIDYRPSPEEIKRETELLFKDMKIPTNEQIVQIKGKGNAKPKDDYLPFVQDFVKGANWSDVGDLKNTGLYRADPDELGMFIPTDPRLQHMPGRRSEDFHRAKEAGLFGENKYLTRNEWEDILRKQIESESGPLPPLPDEGMKRGGKVSISNNPDTMMLEVNNQKMKNGEPAYAGGKLIIGKGLKAAKPPKVEIPRIAMQFGNDLELNMNEVENLARRYPSVDRINMNYKDVTKRVPELTEAAQKLQAGELDRETYAKLVQALKPVKPYDFVPKPATAEEARGALKEDARDTYGIPSQTLKAGHPVGLRLDIPAYTNKGVWVPTVHEQDSGFGAGKKIGHESVASVLNPEFGMSEKAALSIASGKPKGTIATIKGDWNPTSEADIIAKAKEYLKHPEWRQVGMDPERHSYFYDRETMAPVINAEEVIQIGPLVLAKNPKFGKPEDFKYAKGGLAHMKEGGSEDDAKPYFGGAGTKKYAPAKKRAEDADVNLLKDPRTYATVAGFMGERPDEMGFSVLHPDYQGVREAADPAFYAGTALGVAPMMKVLKAPAMALGRAGEKLAENVVPQIMERGGVGADILGGLAQGTRSNIHLPHTEKSPDPTVGTRYKRTDIGGLVPRKDLDIEKLDKSSVKVFPWDASDRNKLVTEVSDIPLTNPVLLEGGDNYMRDIKHVKKRIAGASNEGIANRIQDRIDQASVENQILGGTGKVFGFPIRMADKAEHASTFPTDIAMDLLKQGNLSRKELDDLTNELRGMSFEAKGKGYFQNVAPIDSPEFLVQLREGIKGNKEKGITSVTDMNLRRALMDRLSQKKFQKRLEYNYPDLIGSVIADELKGVPKGWVGNVSAELDPFSKIRPSKSSTYSHDFGGKYYASMPNMPVEFLMPNTFEGIYREMKALYPSAKPEALRNMAIGAMEKRKENISEMIGPRSIDAVKLYQEGLKQGEFDPNDIKQIYDYMRRKKFQLKLKDGGTVKKPAGAVKQPAAYIDGSEFVEAAQKYGIKDSMNNLNKIVDLVNKGLSVDDAARQVADSGMHKAAGGAITGDDLILEERPL